MTSYQLRSGKTYSRKPYSRPVRMPPKATKKDLIQDRQIKQLKKAVKRIEPETKHYDFFTNIATSLTGTAFSVPTLTQGDDEDDRIGEEIRAQSLDLVFYIQHIVGLSTSPVRLMVLWDKQWNGAAAFQALTSINADEGYLDNSMITNVYLSPYTYENRLRYVTLYDKFININPSSTATEALSVIKKHINLRDQLITWTDSGNTVTSLPSRNLLIYMIADPAETTIQMGFRFKYIDP